MKGETAAHRADRMMRRVFGRLVELREGEGMAVLLSFAYFFCLLAAYYILRPLRDEMGVAAGVENLQWLFAGTFVVMLAAVPVYGWVVARFERRVFVPLVYRFFIANLVIFYALMTLGGGSAHEARAFFVWVSVFNLFVVSVFWSLMADLFRSEQGRRLFGFIAAGGTAGALAGPALTVVLAGRLGPVPMLLVSAALLELSVRCVRGLARNLSIPSRDRVAGEAVGGGPFAGFGEVARSPYLLRVSLYIVLVSVLGTVLYFIQATLVGEAFDDPAARTRLFAGIDLAVNGLTIAVQVSLTGRLMRRYGVAPALTLLPAVTLLGLVALAAAPVVAAIVAVQSVQRAANFAVSNPAREVLFTVVSREQKYKCKNVTDTVIFRAADMAAGFAFAALRGAGMSLSAIAAAAAACAAVWAVLAWKLGREQERRALIEGERDDGR